MYNVELLVNEEEHIPEILLEYTVSRSDNCYKRLYKDYDEEYICNLEIEDCKDDVINDVVAIQSLIKSFRGTYPNIKTLHVCIFMWVDVLAIDYLLKALNVVKDINIVVHSIDNEIEEMIKEDIEDGVYTNKVTIVDDRAFSLQPFYNQNKRYDYEVVEYKVKNESVCELYKSTIRTSNS